MAQEMFSGYGAYAPSFLGVVNPRPRFITNPKPPGSKEEEEEPPAPIESKVPFCYDGFQENIVRIEMEGVDSVELASDAEKVTITGKVKPEEALEEAKKVARRSQFCPKKKQDGKKDDDKKRSFDWYSAPKSPHSPRPEGESARLDPQPESMDISIEQKGKRERKPDAPNKTESILYELLLGGHFPLPDGSPEFDPSESFAVMEPAFHECDVDWAKDSGTTSEQAHTSSNVEAQCGNVESPLFGGLRSRLTRYQSEEEPYKISSPLPSVRPSSSSTPATVSSITCSESSPVSSIMDGSAAFKRGVPSDRSRKQDSSSSGSGFSNTTEYVPMPSGSHAGTAVTRVDTIVLTQKTDEHSFQPAGALPWIHGGVPSAAGIRDVYSDRSSISANNLRENKFPSSPVTSGAPEDSWITFQSTKREIDIASRRLADFNYWKDLIREVEIGNGDGYFLSAVWLAGLEEKQRESLMLVLLRTGYSQTYHTSTTTLFERIDSDGQNRPTNLDKDVSSIVTKHDVCAKDTQKVEGSQGGDNLLGTADEDLTMIANRMEIVPSHDVGKPPITRQSDVLDDSVRHIFEEVLATSQVQTPALYFGRVLPPQQQPETLRSFIAALRSNSHHSYCVSTEWLSRLENHEKSLLETTLFEAGYAKVCQTSETTSFERILGNVRHPNSDTSADPSRTHDGHDVAVSDTKKLASSQGSPRSNMNTDGNLNTAENTSGCSDLTTTTKRGRIQDDESTCFPQILKVACSAPPQSLAIPSTSSSLPETYIGNSRRQHFGDYVAIMPRKTESRSVSTTIDKRFCMTTIDFSSGRSSCREASVSLKGSATTTLACCLRVDGNSKKIRIKFSKICGEIKNEESKGQRPNAVVLSSLRTTVDASVKSSEDDAEDGSDEIDLNLEDEYNLHPRRRYLDNDLVWLANSGISPENSEPGSVTLELRGDIRQRCKADLLEQVQRAHVLNFKESRPVIVEGEVPVPLHPKLFLEFNIRYQLEISYIKPRMPISKEAPFICGIRTSEVIEFDCFLEFTTKNLSLG